MNTAMLNRAAYLAALTLLPFWGCNCGDGSGLNKLNPKLVVEPESVTFDTVPIGISARRTLTLKNEGKRTLNVTSIGTEDNTHADFSLEGLAALPTTIEQGSQITLEVVFTPSDRGDASGGVLIQSDDPDRPEVKVPLTATRRQGPVLVVCTQSEEIPLRTNCGENSIDFARVRLEEHLNAKVILRSEGTDPVDISDWGLGADSHAAFSLTTSTITQTLQVGEMTSINVRFNPLAEDTMSGSIYIDSNDPQSPQSTVALSARGVQTGLCVDPTLLDFGNVAIGGEKELTLSLSNCGMAPFDLTGTTMLVGGEEFSVSNPITEPITMQDVAALTYPLKIRYAPTAEHESLGRLRIETSEGPATISLKGEAAGCQLAALPQSLNFVGGRGEFERNVRVENVGSTDCTIQEVVLEQPGAVEPEFGVQVNEQLPHTVGGGEGAGLQVSYFPFTEEAQATIKVTYTNGAPDNTQLLEIPLTGRWEDAPKDCQPNVFPSMVNMGVVAPGTERVTAVSIQNFGFGAGCIKSVSMEAGSHQDLSVTLETATGGGIPGDQGRLALVRFAPSVSGPATGTLLIETENEMMPQISVPVSASAAQVGLCVEPNHVAFGDVQTVTTSTFDIYACGSHEVTVNAIDWLTPDAEITMPDAISLPLLLQPGARQTVTVRYEPTDPNPDTAIAVVRSDDVAVPEAQVRVTGGPEIVPPEAGRFLYYWQISLMSESDVVRQPLQGDRTTEPFYGPRNGKECSGCHALSPDGKYVALTQFSGYALHIIDTETREETFGANQVESALFLSWNPEVNTNPPYQYVYSQNGDLHIASLYTGYIGPLMGASEPNVVESMPSWGPDGQIAFARGSTGVGGEIGLGGATDIMLIDEAGGAATPLAGVSANNAANYYPAFSRNGQWIAFTQSLSAQTTIAAADAKVGLVRADNSGEVNMMPNANGTTGASSYPTWSVDGNFLSFSSNRGGGEGSWDLYIAPIDPVTGQEQEAVNIRDANTVGFEHAAQWSP